MKKGLDGIVSDRSRSYMLSYEQIKKIQRAQAELQPIFFLNDRF